MEATNRGAGPPGIAFYNMGRAHCLVEAVLLEFLRGQNIRNDAKIAVAFSGGPDSTALLTALCAIGWKRPIAVHVDHGIRDYDELSAERKLVESVCSSLGARLIQAHITISTNDPRLKTRPQLIVIGYLTLCPFGRLLVNNP